MSLVFQKKFEKHLKSRLIWGCCNWKTHIRDQVILVTNTLQFLPVHVLSAIEVFPKTMPEKIYSSTLVTPTWVPEYKIFHQIYLCKKTSGNKYKELTPGVWNPLPESVARGVGCMTWVSSYLRELIHFVKFQDTFKMQRWFNWIKRLSIWN